MREIRCVDITDTIRKLCIEATACLPGDVYQALLDHYESEMMPWLKKL